MNKVLREYDEITEKIIGSAFEVFNKLGTGYKEKVYQDAMELCFKEKRLTYYKENYCPVEFKNVRIGFTRIDYLVEGKIIVELKARNEVFSSDFAQVLNYLKYKNLRLGLLILFGKERVKIKRIVN